MICSPRFSRGPIRKGVWDGKNDDQWEHYPEMKKLADAASDHAAILADIDIWLKGFRIKGIDFLRDNVRYGDHIIISDGCF